MAERDSAIAIRYFSLPGYSDGVALEKSVAGCEAVHTGLLRFERLWRLGLVTAAARRVHADLIFSPCPAILPLGALPVAVTIHDAMPERLSQPLLGRRADSLLERIAYRMSAKLSQKILTDSEHSKKDLMEVYNLPPQKISVVYLGYDQDSFNVSPVDSEKQESLLVRLRIQAPYILHHGMVQLRKNLIRLIEAYRILLGRRSSLGLQLVLAGQFGWGADQIRQVADRPGEGGKVILTGKLDRRELALLVKGASLCVIPSLYEGFCLPMVEAMACGIPTITANSSCMPEVSGQVLRYFDPLSQEDMAAAMESALLDSALRKDLVAKGLQRASEFSWRRCARETLMALNGANETDVV